MKKTYISPKVEIVHLIAECGMLAGSSFGASSSSAVTTTTSTENQYNTGNNEVIYGASRKQSFGGGLWSDMQDN